MPELSVQIERLAPMRVAALAVRSDSPETEAINALLDWARPQGLLDQPFRFFGYDNCQPAPNHIYTTWLTVGPAVEGSGQVEIKHFPGGRFAVTTVSNVEQIAPQWKQLAQWCQAHQQPFGGHPGLEEHFDLVADHPLAGPRFKLYLSLRS